MVGFPCHHRIFFGIFFFCKTTISACYALGSTCTRFYCTKFIYSKNLKKNVKKNPNFMLSYLVKFKKGWDIFFKFLWPSQKTWTVILYLDTVHCIDGGFALYRKLAFLDRDFALQGPPSVFLNFSTARNIWIYT